MSNYLYFIDSRLPQNKKTEELLIDLEKHIFEMGIAGTVIKLNQLKSIQDTLSSRDFHNVQTVVGVGGDELFYDLIDVVCEKNLTLGMINLTNSSLLKNLGIPDGLAGCRIIAQRITRLIDCGKINKKYFFSNITIPLGYAINIDGVYNINIDSSLNTNSTFMRVVNVDFSDKNAHQDKQLILEVIRNEKKFLSRNSIKHTGAFTFSKLKIIGSGDPVVADGQKSFKPPLEISSAPRSLKMIVGKNRHQLFE